MNMKYISRFANRLSPRTMAGMIPMGLNFGSYLPIVMKAGMALKDMKGGADAQWNRNEPHPFNDPDEKRDILDRANWLYEQVMVEPQALIDKMPELIGREYQGQWAYYAISMTTVALSNIAYLYPEFRERCLTKMPKLIDLAMTPTIKLYDTMKWKEDPIDSLAGKKSHMTYVSILAWMIGHYKLTGGDSRYDDLYNRLCEALYRRMMNSRDMNLPSFPNGIVFFPDMMFTPLALSIYSKLHGGQICRHCGKMGFSHPLQLA